MRAGFTLVEILIVVVILGILAAVITPNFADASDDSRRAAFISELDIFRKACEYYMAKEGTLLPDTSSGVFPAQLAPYARQVGWEDGTPVGGVWDFETNDTGITAGVGVHFDGTGETRDDAYMVQIDAIIDDGNLAAGRFRRIAAQRYYWVLLD